MAKLANRELQEIREQYASSYRGAWRLTLSGVTRWLDVFICAALRTDEEIAALKKENAELKERIEAAVGLSRSSLGYNPEADDLTHYMTQVGKLGTRIVQMRDIIDPPKSSGEEHPSTPSVWAESTREQEELEEEQADG